jgi:uncharacterized protein (DUF4415 family)
LLHYDTIRAPPAIFTLHGKTTIKSDAGIRYGIDSEQQVRRAHAWPAEQEDCMNKEYQPDWDLSPADNAEAGSAAVTKHPVAQGVKQIVTIRLDVDMLEWFKAAGPGYQTRINQVLREYMDAQRADPTGR